MAGLLGSSCLHQAMAATLAVLLLMLTVLVVASLILVVGGADHLAFTCQPASHLV